MHNIPFTSHHPDKRDGANNLSPSWLDNFWRRLFPGDMRKTFLAAVIAWTVFAGSLAAAPTAEKEPPDAQTLNTIKSEFGKLMELANRHDFKALHGMFWQSLSALLVAKSAISEGNWTGFWGNKAIDQKLHDIGTSGPVVLEPDYSKLKVVGLTQDIAESYVPMNITVSYAGTPLKN
jgi:hypothetical protein